MRINEVIGAVRDAENEAYRNNPFDELRFRIYMDREYWHRCMTEISGNVSHEIYEFYTLNTIRGYDVFQVPQAYGTGKKHPSFEVMKI